MMADEELVAQAQELDKELMRPIFVFRMATARLNGNTAKHVKRYEQAARVQQLRAAREIDAILQKFLDP